MKRFLLAAALFAVNGAVRAQPSPSSVPSDNPGLERCLKTTTPEGLIQREDWSYSAGKLMIYAECADLRSTRSLCNYFPGGPWSHDTSTEALTDYIYVHSSGEARLMSAYWACRSKAPGYELISLLVSSAPSSALLPAWRLLLHEAEEVRPEDAALASQEIFRSGKVASDKVAPAVLKAGFFHYLTGARACADVRIPRLRGECLAKAAAIEAVKMKDASRCLPDDVLCRGLIAGPSVCAGVGEEAVSLHCRGWLSAPDRNPNDFQLEKPKKDRL
jgi:hypothetical protein